MRSRNAPQWPCAGLLKEAAIIPGEYRTLTNEARQPTNVLEDLPDKVQQGEIPPANVGKLLSVSEEGCVGVLRELDAGLVRYNGLWIGLKGQESLG